MTATHAKAGRHIAEIGYTAAEIDVLTITRHFLRSLADPHSHGWIMAFEHAAERRGLANGPPLALSLMRSIHALRISRDGTFLFNNPCCRCCAIRVTQHEQIFMAACRAAATGRTDALVGYALLLCEGADPAELVEAIKAVCRNMACEAAGNSKEPLSPAPVAWTRRV